MTPNGSHDPMHRATVEISDIQNRSCISPEMSHVGNPDELAPAMCGAKTRAGTPCRNLPMKNGRCRMHGGGSTGPRTAAGVARQRAAVTIHGGRSRETREFRALVRHLRADARRLTELA